MDGCQAAKVYENEIRDDVNVYTVMYLRGLQAVVHPEAERTLLTIN
jgi:hypothetical protein